MKLDKNIGDEEFKGNGHEFECFNDKNNMPNQQKTNDLITSLGVGSVEKRGRTNSDGFYDMSTDEHLHESKAK